MEILIGIGVATAIVILFFVSTYNRLVHLRQSVRESWSAIDTELRRRYDLIPNLVEVVKGYAGHERDTLERVIQARNQAMSHQSSPELVAQDLGALTGALRQVFALGEAYPELKANENFKALQNQLEETETRISQARRFYNANVREMNTAVETFPTLLIARSAGFVQQPYFGLDDPGAYEPVRISGLSQPSFGDSGATLQVPETKKEQQ